MKKQMIAMGMMALLTACGGGGGSGGGSSEVSSPKLVKPAQVKCGTKDCLSGATVSSLSLKGMISAMSVDGDSAYSGIKLQYPSTQLLINNINGVITTLNDMAYDNSIPSCEAIPTSGNFSFGGWDVELMAGFGSWNMGDGNVVPDHALKMNNAYGDSAFIAFKCGTPQNIHVIFEGNNGDLTEVFYRVDTATNSIKLQYGSVGSVLSSYGYFENSGTSDFTWALFSNTSSNNSPNGYMMGSVGSSLEFANTYVQNEDIDDVVFGGNTLHYRACVSNYLSGTTTTQDISCGVNLSTTNAPANLIGNASTWSTADVAGLSITRPEDI